MHGWRVGLAVALVACGEPGQQPHSDAGMDAQASYSISIPASTIEADAMPRVVSVTGAPGDEVVFAIDRGGAGVFSPPSITLDAAGNGTATFTPCDRLTTGCVGPATLTLTLAQAPMQSVASAPITLIAATEVGELTPCLTGGNVMYLDGNDYIYTGTLQTGTMEPWSIEVIPDRITFTVGEPTHRYLGTFSLLRVPHPLLPGVYDAAQRADTEAAGRPGIQISSPGKGCNQIDGRFQVHDYTADPVLGTVYSVSISFEQSCDQGAILRGCFHYESTPPPPPPTPTAIDPAKVSVRVLSPSLSGAPDPNAIAIFYDNTGAVVGDGPVDAFGVAQLSLPSGGSLTTIQLVAGREYIHTYRGVKNGDHVVIHPASLTGGAKDLMLATFTPPVGTTGIELHTPCSVSSQGSNHAFLSFYDGCRTPTFDMLSISTPPSGPKQFIWQTGLMHHANRNVAVAGAWTLMSAGTVTLTNVPAQTLPTGVRWSTQVGTKTIVTDQAGFTEPTNQTVTLAYPAGAGITVVRADTGISYGLDSESRTVVDPGLPSAVTIDFAAQPIPIAKMVQQTATGATWTKTAGTADFRKLYWRAKTSTTRASWVLVEPDTGLASATLPTLPAAHAAIDPTLDATAELYGTSIEYIDYDVATGSVVGPPPGAYRAHTCFARTNNLSFPF